MSTKNIEKTIAPLHPYGVETFTLLPGRKNSTPFLYWNPKNNDVLASQWYQMQSAIINSIGFHFSESLINILFKSNTFSLESSRLDDQLKFKISGQFPPDIVKSTRLYACLECFQPDLVLELGCGTSSLVISKYLLDSSRKQECKYIVVDRDQAWLDITQKKINLIIDKPLKSSLFYSHSSNIATINFVKSEVLKSNKKIFVYLDALILDEDDFQGFQLILETFDQFQGELCLLIDSRYKAYNQLFRLANLLNRKMLITTSVLLQNKNSNFNGPHKFQVMNAFTLATVMN